MMINAHCRALQHLMIQGFTLYTCPAAVSTRLLARGILDDPRHAWAVYFTPGAIEWTSHLAADDPLAAAFGEAAVRSAGTMPHVLCHTLGGTLLVPLDVTTVRDARMHIQGAIAQGKAPSAERLEAFTDEMIEREAKRRKRKRDKSKQPKEEG